VQDGLPKVFVLLVEHGLPKPERQRRHHAARGDGFALFLQTGLGFAQLLSLVIYRDLTSIVEPVFLPTFAQH
jgi:hypothetical protein